MEIIKKTSLTKTERWLIEKAWRVAHRSISGSGHKIGCVILCDNGDEFVGATISRTRAIGSTCAERMAVDQLYFNGNKKPKLVILIGTLKRKTWRNSYICTPCGVCLEMFFTLKEFLKLSKLNFLLANWDKTKFIKAELSELYPIIR